MPRSGTGRGTRMGKGPLSGTTVQTSPSGVTLAAGGIYYDGTTPVTPTEIGYLDGAGGNVMAGTAAAYIGIEVIKKAVTKKQNGG